MKSHRPLVLMNKTLQKRTILNNHYSTYASNNTNNNNKITNENKNISNIIKPKFCPKVNNSKDKSLKKITTKTVIETSLKLKRRENFNSKYDTLLKHYRCPTTTSTNLSSNKTKQNKSISNNKKTNIYKSPGNENKFINSKPKKVTVKDGPKNYISKTRELNRLKYYMNLKIETIKDYYYDYRQEIKNIDFTINSIKAYKNNLESKFINEYVSQLRTLNKITLNERLKEEQQRNEIVRLKKDISMMMYNKKRLEITKFLIEKWIGLQIYIKDKVRVEDKQIKKYLNKNYKDQTIFQSSEEFEEFFKKNRLFLVDCASLGRGDLYIVVDKRSTWW